MKKSITKKKDYFGVDESYVGVLDGIRTLSIFIVLWFHFWQQTWLMPNYKTPFLAFLGINYLNFDSFRRCGYLFVDMMLLISAFVLYLPRVKARYDGKKIESPWSFYKRRIARIVPSYVLVVLVMFVYALVKGQYKMRGAFAVQDIITSLTFTRVLFKDVFIGTCIGHVLWTVCIEVYFYLIFPFLSKAFSKMPYVTYPVMVGIGYAFTYLFILKYKTDILRVYVNDFLTFMPVFANGMAAAELYVLYSRKVNKKAIFSFVGIALFAVACWYTMVLMKGCRSAENNQVWQLKYRYLLSITFTVLIFGLMIAPKPLRSIFSCKPFKFLAAISYNVYMWHQWIIVLIRSHYGSSGRDIEILGTGTQWGVTLLGLFLTVCVATLVTYLVEKPCANLIKNAFSDKNSDNSIKSKEKADNSHLFKKKKHYTNKTVKKKKR